jgi:hypothetical protein
VSQPLLGPQFAALQQAQTQKSILLHDSKEQRQHDFFVFENSVIPGGYHEKKHCEAFWKNKMLTGVVGLPFSEMPHRILCSGIMQADKYTKKI